MASVLFILILTACNLPGLTEKATSTPLPPTLTPVPVVTKTSAPPLNTATVLPTRQPSETPSAVNMHGYAIFDRQKAEVR